MAVAAPNRSAPAPARRWLYRLLAILVGLMPFAIGEIGLRIAGIGSPRRVADPFVEFAGVRPLFELNSGGDRYVIPPARQPFFKPDSFAVRKSPQAFRIFCLGGSTVQGNPYSIETSFTTWLKLSLRAADPRRDWEVVNCGGISYASYRLEPILRECLRYQPDLFILYVGDNEFLEERSFAHLKHAPAWLTWFPRIAAGSHLFNLARQAWADQLQRRPGNALRPTSLDSEVNALLDYQGGLAQYHRDDAWRDGVTDHFRFALSSMLVHAQAAKVPVLLVDPVSNVKDCPPFKSEFDPRLSAVDRQRLADLLAGAEDGQAEMTRQIELLQAALSLDERQAAVQYQLGRAYLAAGRDEDARQALFRAKDEDVCPLRLTEPLREVIYALGRKTETPIVPVLREFAVRSPHGIPGDELLLDHVHPTISGHQLIADLLLTTMTRHGWVKPAEDWEQQRQQLYRAHLATLEAPYYARGQEHLEGLRRWAKGRVTKLRQKP